MRNAHTPRALLILVLTASLAAAEPRRVLVVDADAELVHAIETSLAPWKIMVIAQSDGVDPSLVAARAIRADAQFIVWRDGDELLVYDRQRDVTERRPAKTGAMDPVAAAGAALTVKTMMRLPDPTESPTSAPSSSTPPAVTAVAPVASDADDLRIAVGVGIDTRVAFRGALGVMYRPTAQLRIGGTFEFANQSVEDSGFKGSARDYGLLAMASWNAPIGAVEIEPWIGAGALLDVLEGKHGQDTRRETAIVPTGHAGIAVWWWHASQLGVGLTGSATLAFGTPTYTHENGMSETVIYEMPNVGGMFAIVAAWRN